MLFLYSELYSFRNRRSKYYHKDPQNGKFIIKVVLNDKCHGTKTHYVSAFRQWAAYCLSMDEYPLDTPINPELAAYWIADRTQQSGNIKSFCNWQSMLTWLHDLKRCDPIYKYDPFYKTFVKALKKQYHNPSDTRLPFELDDIIKYTIYLKVKKSNILTVDLNTLLTIIIIQLYFFTMSRPSELLKSQSSKNKLGLKFNDISHESSLNGKFFKFIIKSYKNQQFRKQYKTVIIGDAYCNNVLLNRHHKCFCKILNIYELLKVYFFRRKKLALSINNNSILKQKLLLSPNNNVFVWKNGTVVTTSHLSKIVKTMVITLKIPNPKRYAPYSLRIGGTTLASINAIPYSKILRYVGWSDNHLPSVSFRYMRYKLDDFRIMINEMIHGVSSNAINIQKQQRSGVVYDPWAYAWNQKLRRT